MPEPPPRPARPSFVDEVRRPMPPALPERRSDRNDPLTGFTPEPLGGRPEPRPEPRSEPMPPRATPRNEPMIPRPPRASEAAEAAAALARRSARRRPAADRPPPPISSPSLSAADQNLAEMAQRLEAALRRPAGEAAAEPRVGAPPVAPEPPAGRRPPRSEPSMAPPVPASAPTPKSGFENLEDEMASLLGRPKTPS